jgi:hypothetical protein
MACFYLKSIGGIEMKMIARTIEKWNEDKTQLKATLPNCPELWEEVSDGQATWETAMGMRGYVRSYENFLL